MKDQQQQFLRRARSALGTNTEEFAELVGVTLPAMRKYFLPATSKQHRKLPEPARRLIARLVAEVKR